MSGRQHGYETGAVDGMAEPLRVLQALGCQARGVLGSARRDGLAGGTYIHGVFDDDVFRAHFLNELRRRRGLPPQPATAFDRDREFAAAVRGAPTASSRAVRGAA